MKLNDYDVIAQRALTVIERPDQKESKPWCTLCLWCTM